MARVLVPLPARDFDPSEAAVSWRMLANAGHTSRLAAPDGRPAVADNMMLTGRGLDLWGAIPLLRNLPLVGLLMRANRDARAAFAEMIVDPNYVPPQGWDAIGAHHLEPHGPLRSLGISDDRLDLGVRKQRVVGRAHHAVLGSQLLPDLSGREGTTEGLHVSAAGSDARSRAPGRFSRRPEIRSELSPEDLGPGTRFHGQ